MLYERLQERLRRAEPLPQTGNTADALLSAQANGAGADVLWLDLEMCPQSGDLLEGAFLAYGCAWRFDADDLHTQGDTVRQLLASARWLGGHNIFEFDLPHLARLLHCGDDVLAQWRQKCADTLYLATLLIPHQPRYALAKLYRCQSGRNDPLADCAESRALWDLCRDIWAQLDFATARLFCGLLPVSDLFGAPQPSAAKSRSLLSLLPEGNRTALIKHIRTALSAPPHEAHSSWQWLGLAVFVHWLYHFDKPQARRPTWLLKHAAHGRVFQAAERTFWQVEPTDADTLNRECRSLLRIPDFQGLREGQLSVARTVLAREGIALGLLPTGGGKSLAFQLPALILSKYRRSLTVVVSPLKALMEDQVINLQAQAPAYAERIACLISGQGEAVQKDILNGVWQGNIDILYLSPERLGSHSVRQLLKNRPPELWVLDEAHTLSQWGTDFRPDFLRIADHINACYGITDGASVGTDLFDAPEHNFVRPPAFALLTATASPRVREDLQREFADKLVRLTGGKSLIPCGIAAEDWQVSRAEITTFVHRLPAAHRFAPVSKLLHDNHRTYVQAHPEHPECATALVYVRSRKRCESYARDLQASGLACAAYHAKLPESQKKDILRRFKNHEWDVVVCTNAFGMGIDKKGIHTVVHYEPPAHLESYVQEIGRAARKHGERAQAHLFWSAEDTEALFRQERRSRIPNSKTLNDCWSQMRSVLARPPSGQWFGSHTLAAILPHEDGGEDLDTQIRVALLALERYGLLVEHARLPAWIRIGLADPPDTAVNEHTLAFYRRLHALLPHTRTCQAFYLPELALLLDCSVKALLNKLQELVRAQLAHWQAEVHIRRVRRNHEAWFRRQSKILATVCQYGGDAPADESGALRVYLPALSNLLAQRQCPCRDLRQELLAPLRAMGIIGYRSRNAAEVLVSPAPEIDGTWQNWLARAQQCLSELYGLCRYLYARLPDHADNGTGFALEQLAHERRQAPDTLLAQLETLQKLGLIDMSRMDEQCGSLFFIGNPTGKHARNRYHANAYAYLDRHYRERCQRLHILCRWLDSDTPEQRREILEDYFRYGLAEVVQRYFVQTEPTLHPYPLRPDTAAETPAFSAVQNAVINEAGRAALVLAGPGSGKTTVIVHRIVRLITREHIMPEKILVLAYGSTAAAELRQRLRRLLGRDADAVTVSTFHGLARQIGACSEKDAPAAALADIQRRFPRLRGNDKESRYHWLMENAVAILESQEEKPYYQYIMVDEFQDIDAVQFRMIELLAAMDTDAGDPEQQGYLMAVGDDDQNLYAFRGASIEFIRRFAGHYRIDESKQYVLNENYRSRANLVALSNRYIAAALPPEHRLKSAQHAIRAHRQDTAQAIRYTLFRHERRADMGAWLAQDIARTMREQPNARIAVLCREWQGFDVVQHYLEQNGICARRHHQTDLQPAESVVGQALLDHLLEQPLAPINGEAGEYLENWRRQNGFNTLDHAWAAIRAAFAGEHDISRSRAAEILSQAVHQAEPKLSLLSFHRAKGMEFDHVYLIDQFGYRQCPNADTVRALYVALTRAKTGLTVLQCEHACDTVLQQVLRQQHDARAFELPAVAAPEQLVFHRFLQLDEIWLTPPELVTEAGRALLEHTICREGAWCAERTSLAGMTECGDKTVPHRCTGFVGRKNQTMLACFSKNFQQERCKQHFDVTMLGFTTVRVWQHDLSWYAKYGYQGKRGEHFLLVPYVRFCKPYVSTHSTAPA
ncbi:UvrD-helicase domain-containing protein [Conchiformibius kuhniae]|uniref:UvrD-helicase domain-containing protein n=1 Tax=Conchiformibius kuhniae TaxID=211502 RepID=A0ABD8B7D0_9NEIS|nr:UvrD-helicase domain-containing protein [Conchiformibius kuhniae]